MPDTYLFYWVATLIVVSAFRIVLIRYLVGIVTVNNVFAERAYLAVLLLSGCVWAAQILLVEPGNELALFVVLASLIGVISGSAFSNLSYPNGYWFFMTPISVFAVIQLPSFDFGHVAKLAILFVIYIIGLSYIVISFKQRFHDVITLSIENEELAEKLVTSNLNLRKRDFTQNEIISAIPDSIFIMSEAGKIIYQNDRVQGIFGYSDRELIGQEIEMLMPDDFRRDHIEIRDGFYADGSTRFIGSAESKPVIAQHKSGRGFPVEIGLSHILYEDKKCVLAIVRDISEREYILKLEKEIAQRKLIEKEKKKVTQSYQDMVMALGEITYEHYVPEEKIVWTGAYEKVLGYNKEEMGDDDPSWLTRVHPDDLDDVYAEFERAQKTDKIFVIEYRFRAKNGEYLWFYDRGVMTLDKNGKLLTNVGVMRDVTQRRRDYESLKSAELKSRLLLESTAEGIYGLDKDGRTTFVNPAAAKMLGYDIEELTGKPMHATVHHSYPDGSTYPREHCPMYAAFSDGKVHHVTDEVLWRKDGSSFPVEYTSNPIVVNGELTGAVVTFSDISKRKISEDKMRAHQQNLQSALDAAHAGLFTTNVNTGGITWDQRSCEIFGVEDDGHQRGFNEWSERVHPDDLSGALSAFQDSLDADNKFELFYRVLTPAGEERYIHSMGTINRNEKNEAISANGLNIDITAQHTAEVEKELLHKQLQQAQKMESIGQLTGGIAHDFNNILLSVIGFSDLALRRALKNDDEKMIEFLRQVNQAGARAKDLVKQMMVFSRADDGDLKVTYIADIIDEVTAMLRPMLPSSMELETNIDDDIPNLLVDRVQIHQVLTNLCINARDAMNSKGLLKIEVSKKMMDGHICSACHHMFTGEYVAVDVIDSGTGISKVIIDKIFEPFVTSKEVGQGTGMGLSMVHGIVHNHDGHIIVKSQEGFGTRFSILLPIEKEVHTGDSEANKGTNINDEFSELSGKRIFIVDDEESITLLFTSLLEAKGCDVTVFNDSEQALAQFKETPDAYDMVITDQTMPNLTGSEMSKQLLSIKSNLPILMLTGFSDSVNEAQAREIGIRDFMYKPINTNAILTSVRDLLVN